jgi:uncharacterized membrane protein
LLFIINSKTVILIFTQKEMSKRNLYYTCLILGVFLVIFTEFQDTPDLMLQIGGFCLLMLSLYQLSKGIKELPTKDFYVENEEEE